jgi:stage V sporulation protein S
MINVTAMIHRQCFSLLHTTLISCRINQYLLERMFISVNQIRKPGMDIIKVSGTSRTSAVAGAIAGVVREHKRAEVQAIGASAVNQAVKAMALARGYLAEDGIDIVYVPEFVDVDIEGKIRTAIKFTVEPR